MGLFQNEIQMVKQPKNKKINDIKIKCLNGYGAIREQLDEHNTLTVKQPVEVNEQQNQKSVRIGLDITNYLFIFITIYIKQLWRSIKQVISLDLAIRMLFRLGIAM